MIDFDTLPAITKKHVLQTDFSEVVVAGGALLEHMRKIRGIQKSQPLLYLLRKSQLGLFGTHHIEYTRVTRNGTVVRVKAKGTPTEQGALDFNAPIPEPPVPQGPTLIAGSDHTTFIANGKALFDHITKFDLKKYEANHDRLRVPKNEHKAAYWAAVFKVRAERPQPTFIQVHERPEVQSAEKAMNKAADEFNAHSRLYGKLREQVLELSLIHI